MLIIERRAAEEAMAYLKTRPDFKVYRLNAFHRGEIGKEKKAYERVLVGRHMLNNMLNGLVGTVLNGRSSYYATID